jgi:ABC-2 type transport system ATP-binding protein
MPDESAPAIDLHEVTKIYRGKVTALSGIEMRVHRGEVFGLLGPNGAGKSTLVKIMMTVVRATRCRGTLLGKPLGHKPTLARVGYLPENHRFPRYLTGRQVLHFFGALAKVDRRALAGRTGQLLETVGMTASADRPVSTYSKGMMQRIGLAHALINEPDLVLLDEPTDGVDPVGRRDIREVLLRLRAAGKTVFINSHQLGELDALCDRVAILLAGQVVRQGTVNDLGLARQRYEIELAPTTPENDERCLRAAAAKLGPGESQISNLKLEMPADLRPAPFVEILPPLMRIGTTDPVAIQAVIDALRAAGCVIRRVQAVRPSLEELFFDAVGPQRPSSGLPLPGRPA